MTWNIRRAKLDELILKVTRKGQDRFDKRQLALPSYPGILGITNEQGSASVPNVQNYVYVRVGSADTVDRAFNDKVQPRNGTPVWVGYLPHQPTLFQVISVRQVHGDEYSGGPGATAAPHHETHEFGNPLGGDDTTFISPRQITSGLVWITEPVSMNVSVGSASYQISNITYQFAGYPLFDTTPFLPTSKPKWIVLYLDSAEVLKVLEGEESVPLTHQNIPQNTSPVFRLAAIQLEPTTSAITDYPGVVMIKDLRYASVQGNDFGVIGLKTDLIEESTAAEGISFPDVIKITGTVDDNIFRIGDKALDLDFTGVDYDTKVKCQEVGLKFSDDDTPFPTTLIDATSGTWAHSAGNGWQPASSVDDEGPALIIPIVRPGNWYLWIEYIQAAASGPDKSRVEVGAIAATNHVVGYAEARDDNSSWRAYNAHLFSNDGDDTFTERFSGSNMGNPAYTLDIAFRCQNGCISVWDNDDNVWEVYEGRNAVGVSFTPAYAFLQIRKIVGATLNTTYVERLLLRYTL